MSAARWLSVVMLVLALVSGAAWLLQREATAQLGDEIGLLRDENQKLAVVRAENVRIIAALPASAALEAMRADHAAVSRLRAEIEKLKVETEAQASALAHAAMPLIPASEWRNAGRSTPSATVETIVWAISRKDVDGLASMLSIDAQLRPSVDQLFAVLPEDFRARYGTVERWLVDPMVKGPPIDGMQIVGERQLDVDRVELTVRFHIQNREFQELPVLLKHGDDGWRTIIMPKAVQEMANKAGAEIAATRKGG
jgi:hypothetical protein